MEKATSSISNREKKLWGGEGKKSIDRKNIKKIAQKGIEST